MPCVPKSPTSLMARASPQDSSAVEDTPAACLSPTPTLPSLAAVLSSCLELRMRLPWEPEAQ